ncbi:cell division protein PerM, partial [Kineococcus glutinatus]|uniref:cell division protein PerM n=1 Tax=Kineococcus glutinatus TaxID=1070872 RepID=UPI0031EEB918
MTTLQDPRARRPAPRPEAGADAAVPVTAADLLPLLPAAARAALSSLALLVLGVVLTWTAASRTSVPLSSALRVAADLWLLGHGNAVAVAGGRVGVVPLGVTLLAVLAAVRQVRRWAEEQVAAERPLPWGRAAAVFAAGYGVVTGLVALVARMPSAAADVTAAPVTGALLAAAVLVGCGARWDGYLVASAPAGLRRCLRPAATATALLLGAGLLLVVVAVVLAHERVALLHSSLGAGLLGGVLLVLAQALLLPDLAVWGVAWLAGPGFAVGQGTSITPAAAQVG